MSSRHLQTCKSGCCDGQANRHHCTGLRRGDKAPLYPGEEKARSANSTAGRPSVCADNRAARGESGGTAPGDGRGTARAAGPGPGAPQGRAARGCGTRGKAPAPRQRRFTAGGTGAESGASALPARPAAGPRTSRAPRPGERRGAAGPDTEGPRLLGRDPPGPGPGPGPRPHSPWPPRPRAPATAGPSSQRAPARHTAAARPQSRPRLP